MTLLREGKDGEDVPADLVPVLARIAALFGLWRLEKHLTTLYQGTQFTQFIQYLHANMFPYM